MNASLCRPRVDQQLGQETLWSQIRCMSFSVHVGGNEAYQTYWSCSRAPSWALLWSGARASQGCKDHRLGEIQYRHIGSYIGTASSLPVWCFNLSCMYLLTEVVSTFWVFTSSSRLVAASNPLKSVPRVETGSESACKQNNHKMNSMRNTTRKCHSKINGKVHIFLCYT